MPQQLNDLTSAVRLSPRDARIRFALAETQLRLYLELAAKMQPPRDDGSPRDLKEQLRLSGLQHLLLARDLCPCIAGPQIRIAANLEEFEHSDPKQSYLDRAKMLAPADPRLWYLCGVEELADGKRQQAWESWRRALQLSPDYVPLVLNQSANHLRPEEMLQWVLPARADVLLLAAQQLFPEEEAVAERQPFLEKSLAALRRKGPALSTDDWYVKAQVHKLSAQPQLAIEAYRAAIAREPRQVGWRYELAEVLYHEGSLQQARRELETILLQHPNYAPAKRLLDNLQPPGS
jgi:tetratricopeptide (TPR) repeat protein